MRYKNWTKKTDKQNEQVWKHNEADLNVHLYALGVKRYVEVSGSATSIFMDNEDTHFIFTDWESVRQVAMAFLDGLNAAYSTREELMSENLPVDFTVRYEDPGYPRSDADTGVEVYWTTGVDDVDSGIYEYVSALLNRNVTNHWIDEFSVTKHDPVDVSDTKLKSLRHSAFDYIEQFRRTGGFDVWGY